MHLSRFLLLGLATIVFADDWLFNGYGDLYSCDESKSIGVPGNGEGGCHSLGSGTRRLSGQWKKGYTVLAYGGADCDGEKLATMDAQHTCYSAVRDQYFNSVKFVKK